MTSPVTAAASQIATDWAALVPPDRTTIGYREETTRARFTGTTGDRVFFFGLPSRESVEAQCGAALSQVLWGLVARLRISQAGRTRDELADAVANESNLLMRAVEKRATWPAGVLEVQTEATAPELDDNGDAIVIFEFLILTEETD